MSFKNKLDQRGFTLIEIIAVLVILGIIGAIAITKFIPLQSQARDKALAGALAEGLSTASMQYARVTLSKGSPALSNETAAAATANTPGSSDFTYTFTNAAPNVTVSVAWTVAANAGNSASKTKTFILP